MRDFGKEILGDGVPLDEEGTKYANFLLTLGVRLDICHIRGPKFVLWSGDKLFPCSAEKVRIHVPEA